MKIFGFFKSIFTKRSGKSIILMRYGLIIAFILGFAAVVMSKVIDNSVIYADKWNVRSDGIFSATKVINPPRGNILAYDGSVLATNLNFFTLRIDYRTERFADDSLKKYMKPLCARLAIDFPPRTAAEWEQRLSEPLKKPREERTRSFRLLSNLSYLDVQKVRTYPFFCLRRSLTGLHSESAMRRTNPYGDMARRSIGRVGQTAECSEVHGISGLERALDSLLYGTPGVSEKRALTHGVSDWDARAAIPGYDIVSTIDINMQDIVENELNAMLQDVDAEWGVAVLMEVATGNIKAISNLQKKEDTGEYIEAINRAVLGFEPGSVIKTLSMLIALEEGAVTDVNERINTYGGRYNFAGRPITDSHPNASLQVNEVLEQSSNIGMTVLTMRRFENCPGEFYTRVKRLGFLEPMNTGISGERTPRFDSVPDSKGGRLVLSRQCFGYATEIPPLYTLALYNAIANDGVFVRPRLVHRLINPYLGVDSVLPITNIRDRICSEANAATLRDMLKRVVWGEHGTGRSLRNQLVAIAGKTGTSYVVDSGQTSYNLSKKRLTFCGYFPADKPKYSCIVLTCHPRRNWFGAASTSGKVLRNVAVKLYSRGMLGDRSDYRSPRPLTERLLLCAGIDSLGVDAIRSGLAIGSGVRRLPVRSSAAAAAGARTVPDVRGMDLRRAINVLERAGYNVSHSGSGVVTALMPPPATAAPRGATVTLTLR